MSREVINPTKDQIKEYLEIIGWRLSEHQQGLFCDLINHNGKYSGLTLMFPDTDARIETSRLDSDMPSINFYLKDVGMELLDNDCVSFFGKDNKSIFINCMNHSILLGDGNGD